MIHKTHKNILAVDDEFHMLKLLERIIIEKTSYTIDSTSNALEVPDLLKKHVYDVVITDLKMPGLDGLGLLKLIKSKNRFEEVIIITAFGSLDTALETLNAGAFDYITKPFRKEQIIAAVDRVMRLQSCTKDANILRNMLNISPLKDSISAYKKIYIENSVDKHGLDYGRIAEESGLTEDEIKAILST